MKLQYLVETVSNVAGSYCTLAAVGRRCEDEWQQWLRYVRGTVYNRTVVPVMSFDQ